MTYYDTMQQNLGHNPQFGPQQQWGWGASGSQGGFGQGGLGFGQAAYGQQYGQYGGQQPFGAFGYNPGWGGQPFIPAALAKMSELRDMLPEHVALEVDGGVSLDTAAKCVRAGANLLVAGSAIFGAPDPAEMYTRLVAEVDAR